MGETAYDNWKTSEPKVTGPTEDWETAKEMKEKAEMMLDGIPDLKNCLAWTGMGAFNRNRWERYERRVQAILDHYQEILSKETCPGCGEFSDGGKICSRECMKQVRYDEEE